ncbi:vacuolar membrane-associated protein-like protein IML1 [Acephala macrosclerotiorum]|nr:vacuolar membrane-associated protein-like protein IML1 [Acephala macrosclerotiorum]
MPPIIPTTPRHGTQRASHLRQVSNGSADIMFNSRPVTASDASTVQPDPTPSKVYVERRCSLWVHENGFSKDEVVLNLDLFPDVKPGELMAIVALKTDTGVRDFQDKVQTARKDVETLATAIQRERSGSNPRSPGPANGSEAKHDVDLGNRYLFIARDMPKEMKAKQPTLEVSVAKHIADVFCLKHRSNVLLTTTDAAVSSASHVELTFKDEYLARSDMWRLAVGELGNKTVYKGQKILFMGTIKAQVSCVYVDGRKVQSAFFSTTTKPIFRSESARYVLFIQMSREMWDFDSEGSGEIMFNKVVNGFLPALFKKWAYLKAKHLVSIVLFTRVEYDTGISSEFALSARDSDYHTGIQVDGNKRPYKDFYRVVVSEMASGSWTTILYQLKREFKFFRKDISMHRINTVTAVAPTGDSNTRGVLGTRIEAEPSLAMHGNVLEAINLASSQFAHDYIDRDLMRTGISVVVITPCPGIFEVDYETLRLTTESLINNGIGIDLVCLTKMPLHSVPIFRYRNPQYAAFQEALHFKTLRSEDSTPRQNAAMFGSSFSSLNESLSPVKTSHQDRSLRAGSVTAITPPSEWSYAIPHWIDVSFWTGVSQDVHVENNSLCAPFEYGDATAHTGSADFEVRCKMYEMEMASVMENVMTEIAVTPLQHDAIFPQMVLGPREAPGSRRRREDAFDIVQRERSYTSLLEFINGPSKPLLDRHPSHEEKRFYRALDAFDVARSELTDEHPMNPQSNEVKWYHKTGSEEAARKVLAEDPKIFGTSFNENDGTLKAAHFIPGSASETSKKDHKHIADALKVRKDSVANTMTPPSRTSPIRPLKFGRQISLGKHGFGIAAPKAATAEIQIENASAAKPTSTSSNLLGSKKKTKAEMANHFLASAASQTQERPSSSQSEKPKTKTATPPPEVRAPSKEFEAEAVLSSRPMTIKSAVQSLDSTNQFKSRSVLGSLYETPDRNDDGDSTHFSMRIDDNQKVFTSKLLAGSVPELPATLSPTTALSPWLSVLNPSNPSANDTIGPSQYRRWQHVFPRPVLTKTMKWKSLCSPASVPLTTEYFPTKHQLDTQYQQKPYNISQNIEDEFHEDPKTREEFLRELIGLRLSQGFQIVVGPAVAEAFGQKALKIANVFDRERIAEDGASVFMSMGNIIHQLSCVNEGEIEVNMFVRKPTASTASSPGSVVPAVYNPAIRTTLADDYESRQIILGRPKDEYNWNYVDAYIAGFDEEMSEGLRFWRARFVLIPVERPTTLQRRQGEDNEEEIRLEGIKKLTQLWQRHRVVPASERRFHNQGSHKVKDPNPLDIVYKTEDPSVVVTAELETLPLVETGEPGAKRGLLETERFRRSKLDIAALAEAIQAPVEKGGLRMQNRRWHFILHYNCFIGSDMTTWLIENFEDIDTRVEAVEFGNRLMAKDELQKLREKEAGKESKDKDIGIFVHVEKRHPFRDGQYFYQVTGEFSKQRPESRSGWFTSKRRDYSSSIPSTPMSESMMRDSPRPEKSRSSVDDNSTDSGTTTPTTAGGLGKKPKVALSKVMKYDVDHRKRSYRPERINLHYDRLHNPDNCYHIRIDWLGVTAKLIEDAIESWASTAERYGLRLVEAPIGEARSITSIHPFRSPYIIELASQPPDQQPRTYFDISSFAPQIPNTPATRHYYQKAIMKKFNFVLDIEAARNFPSNVEVTYSWGKPDFRYTQYIHRSGVVLAQITDEGHFLLLANRLYNNRTAAAREWDRYVKVDHADRNVRMGSSVYSHGLSEKPTPVNSPLICPTTTNYMGSPILRATSDVLGPSLAGSKLANIITPESIKNELEAFCSDPRQLEAFYKEVLERSTPPSATPPILRSPFVGSLLDSNIPTLGLPPGILARDTSPSPMRLSGQSGIGNPMPPFARRQSVQIGISGVSDGAKQGNDSPRGSIAESDKAS